MAAMGHPLKGDPLYAAGGTVRAAGSGSAVDEGGAPVAMPGDTGYSLHSWQLKLCHPTTGPSTQHGMTLPDLMQQSLSRLSLPCCTCRCTC